MYNSWDLYAQWQQLDFQVKYDKNGAEVGTAPNDDKWYDKGDKFEVKDGSQLKLSGKVFDGWNTQKDGGGIDYKPGDENNPGIPENLTQNLVLYAKWKTAPAHDLLYNNGGEEGSMDKETYFDDGIPKNSIVTVKDNGFTSSRYSFLEWERNDDANTKYQPKATFPFDLSKEAETLTARWGARLTYDGNSPTEGSVPTDKKVYDFQNGEQAEAKGNTGNLKKSQHIFAGWDDTAKDSDQGSGTYQEKSKISFTENKTVYAHWKESPKYHAIYNLNAPEDCDTAEVEEAEKAVPKNEEDYYNDKLKNTFALDGAPSDMALSGYRFDGWATSAEGQVQFQKGDTFTIDDSTPTDINFYAKWVPARKYNIRYDINLPAGTAETDITGPAPVDENNYYNDKKHDKIPVASIGDMGIKGQVFKEWNTNRDGTGTSYQPGSEPIPVSRYSKDITLYAQWQTRLTIAGLDNTDKTYDGTPDWKGNIILNGIRPGDKVTAQPVNALYKDQEGNADRNAGAGKTLELEGFRLTGKGADHYILVDENNDPMDTYTTKGTIHKRDISISPKAVPDRITKGNAIPEEIFRLAVTKGSLGAGDSLGNDFGTPEYTCIYTKPDGTKVTLAQDSDATGPNDSYLLTVKGVENSNYNITLGTGKVKVVEPGTVQAAVTYDPNGGIGSAPVDSDSPYNVSSDPDNPTMVRVLPNTNVTRPGYQFLGWDRNKDCTGNPEFPTGRNNMLALTKDETLYAVWKGATPLTITGLTNLKKTYDGTTAWSGKINIRKALAEDDVELTYEAGAYDTREAGTNKTITVKGIRLTGADAGKYVLRDQGMYSSGTNTIQVNSGVIEKRPITIQPVLPSETHKNTEELPEFGIKLAEGSTLGDGDDLTKDFGTPQFTIKDKEGKDYAVGSEPDHYTVTVSGLANSNYEITCGEAPLSIVDGTGKRKVTLSYDANGADGGTVPAPENYYVYTDTDKNEEVTVTGEAMSLTGCRFLGWSQDKEAKEGGLSPIYQAGDTFKIQGDTTLYAVWAADTPLTIAGFTDKRKVYDNNTSWKGDLLADGALPGDDVKITYQKGFYDNKNVGESRTITAENIRITGEDAFRYYLSTEEDGIYQEESNKAVIYDGAITKRPITIETVVPGGDLRAQKEEDDPTGKFSYKLAENGGSFADGEDLSVVDGSEVNYTMKDFKGSQVSWADIEKAAFYYVETSGLKSDNYEISYKDGRLSVVDKYGTRPVALTYHANGAKGEVPVDKPDNEYGCYLVYEDPDREFMTTHTKEPENLTKEGYKFKEWNTEADGSGTSYAVGDEVVMKDNVDLYAIYTGDTPLIITGLTNVHKTYDGSEKWEGEVLVSGADPEDHIKVIYTDGIFTDKDAGDGKIVKALGVQITGSNLDKYVIKDGKTAKYDADEQAVIVTNGKIDPLPLEVIPIGAPGEVDFSGSIPVYRVDRGQEMPGHDLFLPAQSRIINPDELKDFGEPQYSCKGTNGKEMTDTKTPGYYRLTVDGLSHKNYDVEAGSSYIQVYAPGMKQAKVTYRGNGGRGIAPIDNNLYATFDDTSLNSRVKVQGNTFTRTGYKFKGWNTKANGKGTTYQPGSEFRIMGDTVLYAVWERIPGMSTEVPETVEKPDTKDPGKSGGSISVKEEGRSVSQRISKEALIKKIMPADAKKAEKKENGEFELGKAKASGLDKAGQARYLFEDEQVPLGAGPNHWKDSGLWGSSIWNCFLHWIILLCAMVTLLYGFLRRMYIGRKEPEDRKENLLLDRVIPLLSLPLSVVFYYWITCILDFAAIILLITASVVSGTLIYRAYHNKEEDEICESDMTAK